MKWPWKVTSWVVLWGRDKGAMLASLCVSWMTALVNGRFFLSSTCTWRLPITLLSSSWTWSRRRKKLLFFMKRTSVWLGLYVFPWKLWISEAPTLYLWILGHEQKSPSQCSCCCISASSKQIHNCVQKVFIVEVAVGNPRFLQEKTNQCRH